MREKKAIKKRIGWGILAACVVGVTVVAGGLFLKGFDNGRGATELPRLNISLRDATLGELNGWDKTTRYPVSELTLANGLKKQEYVGAEIKGRGNSTWVQEKKPYQIKFQDRVDLLGLGKAKKWVLLANHFDASNLRNDVAFRLEQMLNGTDERRGEFVELVINGEYLGLYYLTKKIDTGKDFVGLKDPLGVLVEMENLRREEEMCYDSSEWSCLIVKGVVSKDNEAEAMKDFLDAFDELEDVARKGDYEQASKIADMDSFAKYYLLSEFSVNPDAYTSSYYFYKDGAGDLIHAGPSWDFDFAFGNKQWSWNEVPDFHSPYLTRAREPEAFGDEYIGERNKIDGANVAISRTVYYLMRMPEFEKRVREVYNDRMAGRKNELLSWMERRTAKIYFASERNEKRWSNGSFKYETESLFRWVASRYDYFEETYGDGKW